MTDQTTSIMCVLYNRLPLTQRWIASLFATTKNPYRLILVDNGSTDGTVEWLKDICQHTHNNIHHLCVSQDLLFNEQNLGIASGRNQCLQIADKYNDPYLATVDNDVEFPDDWLGKCLDIMQANPQHSIGVNFERDPYRPITRNGKTFQLKEKGNLGTACMVFDRRLHDKIGFFTTEYERFGHEDADWGFRARRSGYQLGYLLEAGIRTGLDDTGEYRKMKDEYNSKNLGKFQRNCALYANNRKDLYIPFSICQ
jgi:GT2 family glycosyltransferase